MAGRLERGDVRLHSSASHKARPVVILTRSSVLTYLSKVTVAPVTSTIRGIPSEVRLDEGDGMKAICVVNLDNTMTVRQSELGKRVALLSAARMHEICDAIRFSLGCD